jgi:hypothetical protein
LCILDFSAVIWMRGKLKLYIYRPGTAQPAQGLVCGLSDQGIGVRFPVWVTEFVLLHSVQTGAGAHQASGVGGQGVVSSGVNLLGYEACHSTPSSAGVKNAWSCTSTTACMASLKLTLHEGRETFLRVLQCAGVEIWVAARAWLDVGR